MGRPAASAMAQESPNRLSDWYLAIRAWLPTARVRLHEWYAQVREEPRLIWETTAIRCGVYVVGAALVFWLLATIISLVTPPPPADALPPAQEAYFHVICASPSCGHHFTIYRKKSFDDFPVACPRCRKETGQLARQCFSSACRGRWVVPLDREGRAICPQCGAGW